MILHLTATSLDPHSDGVPTKRAFTKSEIVIGRLPSCDFSLADSTISATHAKLSIDKDPISGAPRVFIEDLGSSNGTSVEHIRLSPFTRMAIEPDQWVRAGQYLIKAVLDPASNGANNHSFSAIVPLEQTSAIENHLNGDVDFFASLYAPRAPGGDNNLEDGIEAEELPDFEPEGIKMADEMNQPKDVIELEEPSEPIFRATLINHDLTDLDIEAFKLILIQGIACRADGTPINGVEINGGSLGIILTNENGRFSFGPVREGLAFEISASLNGFQFENATTSGKAKENAELEFRTIKTFAVSGRVMREGMPLSEVEIDAGSFGSVKTDSDGRYMITGIPANTEITLRASKQGFGFGRQVVQIMQ